MHNLPVEEFGERLLKLAQPYIGKKEYGNLRTTPDSWASPFPLMIVKGLPEYIRNAIKEDYAFPFAYEVLGTSSSQIDLAYHPLFGVRESILSPQYLPVEEGLARFEEKIKFIPTRRKMEIIRSVLREGAGNLKKDLTESAEKKGLALDDLLTGEEIDLITEVEKSPDFWKGELKYLAEDVYGTFLPKGWKVP
ncbi:hypothetical protein D6764_02640 [Candidatus Woesearchaeota archaeon]|nr:MAG: hypothetical protein D6764_02640 [Candidatus Woesearchaeota archaeon]